MCQLLELGLKGNTLETPRSLFQHLIFPGEINDLCSGPSGVAVIILSEVFFVQRGSEGNPYDERYVAVWHPENGACVFVCWYNKDESHAWGHDFQPKWRGLKPYGDEKFRMRNLVED